MKHVKGDLVYKEDEDYSELVTIEGDFNCEQATEIDLPKLKRVEGSFICGDTTEVSFPKLERVVGRFYCRSAILILK